MAITSGGVNNSTSTRPITAPLQVNDPFYNLAQGFLKYAEAHTKQLEQFSAEMDKRSKLLQTLSIQEAALEKLSETLKENLGDKTSGAIAIGTSATQSADLRSNLISCGAAEAADFTGPNAAGLYEIDVAALKRILSNVFAQIKNARDHITVINTEDTDARVLVNQATQSANTAYTAASQVVKLLYDLMMAIANKISS